MACYDKRELVQLHPQEMELGVDGLKEYYWPIGFPEVLTCRDAVMQSLVSVIGPAWRAGVPGGQELYIHLYLLVTETLALMQGEMLCMRAERDGKRLNIDSSWRYLDAVYSRQAPELPSLLKSLQTEHSPRSLRHIAAKPGKVCGKLLHSLRTGPNPENTKPEVVASMPEAKASKVIHHGRPTGRLLREGIVTTKRDHPRGVISRHAASQSEPVVLIRRKFWFSSISNRQVTAAGKIALSAKLRGELLEAVSGVFGLCGVKLQLFMREYLGRLMDGCAAVTKCHMDHLRAHPERLPRRLWTGTCGNIWDCMLRFAVREAGGSVTGHDHAGGPHYMIIPQSLGNEFRACDRFVTYNEAQADLIREHGASSLYQIEAMPEIVGLPAMPPEEATPATKVETIRRILVPGSLFSGDMQRVVPSLPDPVMIDFHAQLFEKLKSWGYEVIFKPHPESMLKPEEVYARELQVKVVQERFEDILDQTDLLLHCDPLSTVFTAALNTDKPMVYVDQGRCDWLPGPMKLLGQRCGIVHCLHSQDGRIDIDWEQLKKAIVEAPEKRHHRGFAQCLLL